MVARFFLQPPGHGGRDLDMKAVGGTWTGTRMGNAPGQTRVRWGVPMVVLLSQTSQALPLAPWEESPAQPTDQWQERVHDRDTSCQCRPRRQQVTARLSESPHPLGDPPGAPGLS